MESPFAHHGRVPVMRAVRAQRVPAHSPRAGFTLIEMLVVLAIITVLAGIALASQRSFNRTLLLANTAYDIALTLRSAETYGLGARAAGAIANAGYGVHFDRAAPGSFVFFADSSPPPSTASACHPTADASAPDAEPGDCAYEAAQGEQVTTFTIGNGAAVSDFCAYASGSWSCANSNGSALSTLDVVFARPNPDPFMSVNGAHSLAAPVTAACLVVSAAGASRYVSVSASGSITASATSCP